MLQRLSIKNYAIIEQLEIQFSGKLNVITGETGAGKSIIVGALGLILGERADSSALVNKELKCVIEGYFTADGKEVIREFLKTHDLDPGEELVLRREISPAGKSRAFINDTPVNLSQLQELSTLLVDLHQQFDTQALGESDFQRQVLDALAGNHKEVQAYRRAYQQWQDASKMAQSLRRQKEDFDKQADYNRFQYEELEEAGFQENELEQAEQQQKMLENAEGIKNVLTNVYFTMAESDNTIVQQIKQLANQLQVYASYHASLPGLLDRLQSTTIELQDISAEIEQLNEQVNHDPEKIAYLNDRLSLGYKLQKKHGVQSTQALLDIQEELAGKLQAILGIDEALAQKEKESQAFYQEAELLAASLSVARKKQVKTLEDKVNKLLIQVGMPNAKLKVQVALAPLGPWGVDAIEFLFDANKSGQFQPVRKVASGGELSRLMLCIKSLVAQSIDLPTLIFDEIDTGISGEAAKQVGVIMKDLAGKRQVICITHQPQIAGKADSHFFVYKEIIRDQVQTSIRQLSADERILAIAKMLSGEKPTAAAMENAREMVGN